ncbi:glycosyltransferase [Salinispora oceanensis]|uniref:glycosyltransferase n=1 Tax=Salinispora oceanensis TaxID=1050199 RepID=UPI00036BF53F|nr:glycosyltransferase [Salinispora oceanensis]
MTSTTGVARTAPGVGSIRDGSEPPAPTVSVIVPNYNKAASLADCLRSIEEQTRPPVEIIVVDDASTDRSRQIAAEFGCQLIALPTNRGVSAARNVGAAAASGDVLFFLDSDIALASEAIATAVRTLRTHSDCAVVQGIYDAQPLHDGGPVEVYKTLFEHYWRRRGAGVTDATLFALTAIPRPVFEEVGGFDETLRDAEDIEFGTRLPARYEIRMSADVLGRHDDVDRFWPYLSEHVRRAVGYGRLLATTLAGHRRAATGTAGTRPDGGRAGKTVDRAAVAAMLCCAGVPLALPLVAVAVELIAVPLLLAAGFAVVDRGLLGFVRRRKGHLFLAYFVGMHMLMHATQLVGMAVGAAVATVDFRRRRGATAGRPPPDRSEPSASADADRLRWGGRTNRPATTGARWRRLLHRAVTVLFVALLTVGLVTVLRGQDWRPVRELAASLDLATVYLAFGAAFTINCVGLVFGVLSWRALFADLGARVDPWTASRIFFVGFLVKFVPGRFVALPVLLRLGRAVDVGPVRLASVFMVSWGIVALTGVTVGLGAGPAVAGTQAWWLLGLAALPVLALLIRPDLLNLGIRTAARVLRRPAPTFAASRSGLRRAIVTQSLSWIISGHHLWLLAVVAGAPPGRAYLLCVAGFALATVAGLVVMVAPDGIGVREGVLALALATVLPLPLAGTVVLASRIVSVLSDVVVGAGGLLLAEYLHRRRSRPAGGRTPDSLPADHV